ncbi:DUF6265 family protein [Winogradskyella sp. UBA3174]|uniref:DUF6265 family protein n=1 Tax=Winogradskyella sp. UBA3174 TaxID=1947785 RepID=UPI0025F3FE44|nr:DUF6265 family protein [Winogradskyella sp. UBA3174]|tara:strand:- start:13790 stop:14938 length:1149 start_codon:yes stop_codon:yes gene_type:complete
MKYLFVFLFIIPFISISQEKQLEPKLENIAWIAGTWYGEAFGGQTEEIWSEPSGGSMMASFKLINDGKVTFYEIEIIREVENTLILQLKHFGPNLKGWETKDETVDFPLKEITENKVVFEVMTFEKLSKNEMNIYVDIKEEGKTKTVKFNYKKASQSVKPVKQLITVKETKVNPIIDGIANESIWKNSQWHQLDQLWLGENYSSEDFKGRYKLTWTKDALYLLAEIIDDVLTDNNEEPLTAWWDDDCLEIFIDEDNSGGNHQFSHNAFAYHIALDGNVVDMSTERKGKIYNSHIESKRKTTGNTSIWEVKISLFDDTYNDDDSNNSPITLTANKNIGFALAYCDNDNSKTRENFIGSIAVLGDDKNKGWIDANIFGTLLLTN